jgi:glutamate transport system substrate-binding protein
MRNSRRISIRRAAAALSLAALGAVAACSSQSTPVAAPVAKTGSSSAGHSSSGSPASANPGTGNVGAVNALIANEAPAPASAIAADAVAAKIRSSGTLVVGGVETAPLFSLLDPATGHVSGFDAGISQLLAKYITGKNSTKLVNVTADTREALLENHSVDVVVATYTITPARAKLVRFAGPYFEDGLGIAVRTGTTGITSAADLAGKTVVTESGSTIPTAVKAVAPTAKIQLFGTDAECVQALEQGRADAYVLDQGVLAGDALTNPGIKVLPAAFDEQPLGIGVPHNEPQFEAFVNTWLQKIESDGTWAKLWKATIGTAISGQTPVPPKVG